jgi:hypothetical protein
MSAYRHKLVVEIDCLDAQGQRQAQNRLLRWLETFGHTAVGSGFEFKSVGVMTGKRVERRKGEE